MSWVLGVDVGSQSVKALLLDPQGRPAAEAACRYRIEHPASGWAEQDPDDWWACLGTAVRSALAQSGVHSAQVTRLCLASQVDGLVASDTADRPLRPAVIWLDRRASAEAAELAEAVGADTLFGVTGCNPDASHVAPKIMWLRRHEPQLMAQAASLLPVGGWLLARLTGRRAQDPANASSTLLFDLAAGGWSDPLLAAAGVDPGLLAEVLPASECAGPLTAEAAEHLGLGRGCLVLTGTGDEHAASVGAGAVVPGVVADVTGTAEPVTVTAEQLVLDPQRMVETHAHALAGRLLVENPGFVSGGSTLWLSATVLGVGQPQLIAQAASAPPGADGALFLPTLSGATTPVWDDRMRGAFAGLSMHHGPAHLARAVVEGCTYALRDVVDRLTALGLLGPAGSGAAGPGAAGGEVRVVGGGARSRFWLQLKADVLGRPVRAVLHEESAATGAALLAAVSAGTFSDLTEAVAHGVHLDPEPFLPDAGRSEVYQRGYESYRRLFDGVRGAEL